MCECTTFFTRDFKIRFFLTISLASKCDSNDDDDDENNNEDDLMTQWCWMTAITTNHYRYSMIIYLFKSHMRLRKASLPLMTRLSRVTIRLIMTHWNIWTSDTYRFL